MSFARLPALLVATATGFAVTSMAPSATLANEWLDKDYTCANLWNVRNNIYYGKGYCFKTKRGKAAFPDSCFPPYGKLTRAEKKEVELVKKAERAKGC